MAAADTASITLVGQYLTEGNPSLPVTTNLRHVWTVKAPAAQNVARLRVTGGPIAVPRATGGTTLTSLVIYNRSGTDYVQLSYTATDAVGGGFPIAQTMGIPPGTLAVIPGNANLNATNMTLTIWDAYSGATGSAYCDVWQVNS